MSDAVKDTAGWKIPAFFQNSTKLLPRKAQAAGSLHPFSEAEEVPPPRSRASSARLCVMLSAGARDWGIPSVLQRTPPPPQPVTNEFVCSVCQEMLLWEQRRLVMNYSSRTDACPSLLGTACKGTPCAYQAQVPLRKIIIIITAASTLGGVPTTCPVGSLTYII